MTPSISSSLGMSEDGVIASILGPDFMAWLATSKRLEAEKKVCSLAWCEC